jgi:outer membrane receptor protein involved in Fe transport
MFLQSSFVEEFSKIRQDRLGVTNTRSFKYLKPRFEFRYDITDKDQIRIVAERTVSQLNLNNFVASRNTDDDTINFGNPDLVPEKRWVYSAGYEKRFANDAGSIEAKISYEDISDHIDRILIGTDSSGTGNIGDARWYGADIKANIRFGFIGIPNAVASVSYRYRDTQTTDPFTGLLRETKSLNPHYWNIDFQHELTEMDLMYGFNFHKRAASFRQDIYLTEGRDFLYHSSLFGEYKFMENMKMRLDVRHIFNDRKKYYKTYYDGNIADGVVERIDSQVNETDTFFHMSFQATF